MAGKVEAVTIAGSVSPGFRYASLNFNMNVKGREFNLLEVGYRHLLLTPLSSQSLWELPSRSTFQNSWEKINQHDNIITMEHHTPAIFARINGNEVAYTWTPMIPLMLMKEATRWLLQVQLDENTEFVTSGGLSLQVSTLLATTNRLSKERALQNSYLELDTRFSYEVQSKTAFLLPTGPVGFRTDDRVYASLDVGVGKHRSENQFDFIYRGSDSKKPMFKYA
ncbi:unnamed protein product [Dibothriocephalus latus]|uniref:Uncharacterized protein n=1 Tax=Dibothriocephalus latus TaxID=60516 RepID=A0A3P7L9L9_DIBLA|nr:unnamed protein product [Dibothriocephalus latus]